MYLAEAAHHTWVGMHMRATDLGIAPATPPFNMAAVKTRGDICYLLCAQQPPLVGGCKCTAVP